MRNKRTDDSDKDQKKLAIFDFDGTLVAHDSLKVMMFKMAGGRLPAFAWLAVSMLTPLVESLTSSDRYMDYKTAIKSHWIRHVLRGKTVDDVQKTARDFKESLGWHKGVVEDLKQFAEQGYEIVVATGALDVYIDILLQGLPVKTVVCTMVEVGEDGRLTGYLKGEKVKANAVRDEKRIRMQSYIKQNGPYGHIVGYGNMPDDGPMLSLCDDFHVI